MNKIKKTIAIILCLVLATSSLAFADEIALTSAPTKDYAGHWAEGTIQKWMDAGKISGYSDGSYKPDNNITRAEFVKLVNGTIDFNKKATVAYKDVTTADWFYDYVGIAQEIGYISGYSKDSFGPNDYITREQAASILARIQYLNGNVAAAEKFSDKAKVSSWAAESVGAAFDAGFITGYNDGTFRPSNKLTRAEALTMLDNVLVNAKNVIVYKDGAELKDKVVEGDLIIAKTVGDGNVHLTNVEVKGVIKVLGGGLNSVYFNNVKVSNIEVLKDKVRLVFADGSVIENIKTGSETVLENTDGTIAKITVTGEGEVTLTGKFDSVSVTGNANIVLDDAVITTLTVSQPITIEGTGTIATLEANANGIQFEAEVEITKTVTGEGVTEKPVVVVEAPAGGGGGGGVPGGETAKEYKLSFNATLEKAGVEVTDIPFIPTKTFKDTEIVSSVVNGLIPEIKILLDNESVKPEVLELLNLYNSKIENADSIKLGNKVIYTKDTGWNENAYSYLNGTNVKTYLDSHYPDLLNKTTIELDDLTKLLNVYAAVYSDKTKVQADLGTIKTKLENEFNEDSTQAITFTFGGTDKSFVMNFDAAHNAKDVSGINQINELVDFINANYENSYTTLSNFVTTYGNTLTITSTVGDVTSTFTISITEK
jgi:hypothetical protein